jgi:hypothetical protein
MSEEHECWNDAIKAVVDRLQRDGSEDAEGNVDLADTIDRIRALAKRNSERAK